MVAQRLLLVRDLQGNQFSLQYDESYSEPLDEELLQDNIRLR